MNLRSGKSCRKPQSIDAEAYLKRIGLQRQEPSLRFLRNLHYHHLLSIPYENLDIHYGRKIELRITDIFNKVINHHRGGIAFELNLLFYLLLAELEFDCYLVSVRHQRAGTLSQEFDHLAVIVRSLQGIDYLCDVGFGDSFIFPKAIELNVTQLDYTLYYRFEKDVDEHWVLKSSNDNSHFSYLYQFSEVARSPIEFIPRCNTLQEDKLSTLWQHKFITQLFREGRITLTDRILTLLIKGERTTVNILNEDAFLSQLEQHFRIKSSDLLRQLID